MVDLLNHDEVSHFSVLSVSVTGDQPRRFALPPAMANLVLDMSPRRHLGFWASQLDGAVGKAAEPIVLVAQGVACLAIAHWAQLSPRRYVENIAGAYFHAPLSYGFAQAGAARSLLPGPRTALPFPSLVIDSRFSPIVTQLLETADIWGSRFVEAERFDARGHGDIADAAITAALAMGETLLDEA